MVKPVKNNSVLVNILLISPLLDPRTNSFDSDTRGCKGRTFLVRSYLCVDIRVRCFNLNIKKLSDYQDELHDKIKELHDSGLGYRRIAYWLNENQYKTPRGHEFKNNHVHSILKKRRIRNERINKPYELTFSEWYIREVQ